MIVEDEVPLTSAKLDAREIKPLLENRENTAQTNATSGTTPMKDASLDKKENIELAKNID